jgi:hypothetical protein
MAGTLNDALGLQEPRGAPAGEMAPMDVYMPQDVEEIFRAPGEKLPMPDPMQVRVADASGSVPLPARAPEMFQNRNDSEDETVPLPERGERSPEMFKGPLVSPNDSRYSDVNNLIVGDVITGGALPWIQAVADLASGRIPIEQFDAARQEHEKRIEEIKAGHANVVTAAEKAMPFLSGLGIGMLKPARTIAGTVGRGAAVAGAEGFVQGATSGPIEEPTLSGERLGRGIGGAAEGAALGGLGAALPGGAKETKEMLGRRADRIAKEDAVAATAAAKKAASAKTQQTKAAKLRQKQLADEEVAKDKMLVDRFKTYRNVAGEPAADWKEKRHLLNEGPESVFKAQAQMNADLSEFSQNVNLPPVAILNKLRGANIKPETPQERILYNQLQEVEESWLAVRRRGTTGSNDNTPAPAATVAQKATKPSPDQGLSVSDYVKNNLRDPTSGQTTTVSALYTAYASEARKVGGTPMSQVAFRKQLVDAGITPQKIAGQLRVEGALNTNAPSTPAKPSGPPAKAATKPASPKPARTSSGSKPRSSKSAPAPRKPGDEPIRTPTKPNRADRDY